MPDRKSYPVVLKNEVMEKNLFVLIIVVLVFLAIIILLIAKNHKDKKGLFKKLPGDYPDPDFIKSEFDNKV
jgi:hypothetical protein